MECEWQDLERIAMESRRRTLNAMDGFPDGVSVESFILAATNVGALDHYKVIPQPAKDIIGRIERSSGFSGVRIFLRAVLAQGVIDLIQTKEYEKLPPLVSSWHRSQLFRIARDTSVDAEWLDISNDLFHKEFGLVTLRLYAAGAQLVDFRCGIPRSILFRESFWKVPGKFIAMLRFGGFKPYFQIHTHTFNLDLFNEKGWNECYRCCAELYSLHPKSLGMFGGSWFYDPSLDSISPRLAYLRTIPEEGGALLMFVMNGGESINNSLSTSPTRRKLYEEGKYMPRSYMLIWGRDDQIKWAKQHPGHYGE